jgi:hypothetical protein
MAIIKSKHASNYTVLPNDIFKSGLPLESFGLLAYLLSLPHDWVIYKTQLHSHLGIGREKLNNAFNKLVDAGYILSVEKRNESGKIEYEHIVYDKPFNGEPITEIPLTEKPLTGKPLTVNPPLQSTKLQNTKLQSKEYKENNTKEIPEWEVFKEYGLENKPNVDLFSLELKYKSWIEAGWQNGNGKSIKNWKSALLNTLPYIKTQNNEKPKSKYGYGNSQPTI